jgi:phosphoglycerol geranylgeranyltransferase
MFMFALGNNNFSSLSMKTIYQQLLESKKEGKKLLAILLDPDKLEVETISLLAKKINQSPATHIFVGGSSFLGTHLDELLIVLKKNTTLPILLFPGNINQISKEADGILFLQLLSGRNTDYLIDFQVNAVPILKKTNLEVISTGYLLIDGGSETSVQRVSNTKPLDRNNIQYAYQTAQAGEYIGNKLIYLEAGSGAKLSVPTEMISYISKNIEIPIIVGGGICSLAEINKIHEAGADLVVIGTAFENDTTFFNNY